jgi:hypothetical protein
MVEIHTLSLRQFVAICLLGQHTKSHTEPFLRFDPILSPTATGPGCPTASRFRVILKDSFVLSGIELVAHADEYGPTDARKRNKKTCVFGCLERVSVQPGVEKMVRQHVSSQGYGSLLFMALAFDPPTHRFARCLLGAGALCTLC